MKNEYEADSSSAEIILRLKKTIPELNTVEVYNRLLDTLEFNCGSLITKCQLLESCSDSEDFSPRVYILMRKKMRRKRNKIKRESSSLEYL